MSDHKTMCDVVYLLIDRVPQGSWVGFGALALSGANALRIHHVKRSTAQVDERVAHLENGVIAAKIGDAFTALGVDPVALRAAGLVPEEILAAAATMEVPAHGAIHS